LNRQFGCAFEALPSTAKAGSVISKQTAETKLTAKGPAVMDSLKDWIGGLTGKIKHKKKK
jgi:hypothetical protein